MIRQILILQVTDIVCHAFLGHIEVEVCEAIEDSIEAVR